MGLGRSAARGMLLASGANFSTYALSFGASVLLAHLLSPTNFGEAALAIAIADLLFLVGGFSLPIALLREPEASVGTALRTSMTMTAAATVGLLAIGSVIALALSSWVAGPVGLIFAVILASRIPPLFGTCLTSELQRRNAYGLYSAVVYGSQAFSVLVAVGLGLAGAGVWALAGRELAAGSCLFLLAMTLSRWRIQFGFDSAQCRALIRFGVLMLGSRIGDVLFHRYDNLMVGLLAGTRQLGLYNQAYVVAELGNKVYAPVIYQVPMSVYSQLQADPARTGLMYQLMMFAIVRSVLPLALIMLWSLQSFFK